MTMNISAAVLDAVANLLNDGIDSAPFDDEVKWRGLDEEEADALEAVLDEITHSDLYYAAECAARRLTDQRMAGEDDA
jgi:hypothetical protein